LEIIIQTGAMGLAEVYENFNLGSFMHLVPSSLQSVFFWGGNK